MKAFVDYLLLEHDGYVRQGMFEGISSRCWGRSESSRLFLSTEQAAIAAAIFWGYQIDNNLK